MCYQFLHFEVLMAVNIKITVSCSLIGGHSCLTHVHLQGSGKMADGREFVLLSKCPHEATAVFVGAFHGIPPHVANIDNRFTTILICKFPLLCNNIPIAMTVVRMHCYRNVVAYQRTCGNLPQSSFTQSASLRESCRLAYPRGE
jgi:hypothetical protein